MDNNLQIHHQNTLFYHNFDVTLVHLQSNQKLNYTYYNCITIPLHKLGGHNGHK